MLRTVTSARSVVLCKWCSKVLTTAERAEIYQRERHGQRQLKLLADFLVDVRELLGSLRGRAAQ